MRLIEAITELPQGGRDYYTFALGVTDVYTVQVIKVTNHALK